MQTSLYVAVSGQLALERQLSTIANNVANAGTVGFRAEGIQFSSILSRQSRQPTAFVTRGEAHVVDSGGALTKTGNPLDVAVSGPGYLAIQTPGGVAYTRDGRMQMLETGDLVTVDGYPVLDAGNAPIVLDPNAGPPEIARDGMISQSGRANSAIGLFDIDLTRSAQRFENSAVIPRSPGTPILSFDAGGIVQGYVEESNVNPVSEMSKLIEVTRAFDSVSAAMEEGGNSLKEAIQVLASRS